LVQPDVTTMPSPHEPADLRLFFHPESFAVVGASDREGSPNRTYWNLIKNWALRQGAQVFPVNPTRSSIDGIPCFESLTSLPIRPNVTAILTGDPVPVLREAVALGVDFAVVFASGYAEAGPEGLEKQNELRTIVAGSPTRLIGPNTNLNTFETFRDDLDGKSVALITQSGHQGRPIYLLQELGVPVSYWAPTGNEADLTSGDFMRWFVSQPNIGAIAMYLEAITDLPTFVDAAAQAQRAEIPILVVKSGSSDAGKRTALTHTGKLAGSTEIIDAFFSKFGIIRLETLEEWTDTTRFMLRADPHTVGGVAVVSISGGTSAYSADLIDSFDLPLATFRDETVLDLRRRIPEPLKVDNPVDTGGHPLGDERGIEILRSIVADDGVGVLVCPLAAPFPPLSTKFLRDLALLSGETSKPICVVWCSPLVENQEVREILDDAPRLHFFRSFRHCLVAVQSWMRFHEGLRDQVSEGTVFEPLAPTSTDITPLDEFESRNLLRPYGLFGPAERRVQSAEDAVDAAETIGLPVVVKGLSNTVQHKMSEGLVALDLYEGGQVRTASKRVLTRLHQLDESSPSLLVAEQLGDGLDLLVGSVEDPEVGLAIVVGIGGTHAELVSDVCYLIPPFSDSDVRSALSGLRNHGFVATFLAQVEGGDSSLLDALHGFSRFVTDNRDRFRSVEINPLRIMRDGRAVVLDTLAT